MSKTEIKLIFDEEKLGALEFYLKKEGFNVQKRMSEALEQLYGQTVPEPVREYLDSRAAPPPRPKRPPRPAARERPVPSGQEQEGGV